MEQYIRSSSVVCQRTAHDVWDTAHDVWDTAHDHQFRVEVWRVLSFFYVNSNLFAFPFSFARSSLVAGVRASLSGLQCTRWSISYWSLNLIYIEEPAEEAEQ
jgi:hypothetical protein